MNHGEGEKTPHRRKNVFIAVGFDGQSCGSKLHPTFFVKSARGVREAIDHSLVHQAERQTGSGEFFSYTLSAQRRKKAH
ncbi:hypothetical protein [Pseudomonas sp. PDM22]|uniref:hypothetical protein n=1 Tax=Pseudomonas sp. PDM22 TaxID=2769287 RepID=UPI001780A01F|nr:hypothetical protein [Pseudomonas sp. PDM22]MBD9512851.1 hypothetical protein [Pseudomonas sp. PDM22]